MKEQALPGILSEGLILALVVAPFAYLAGIWASLPETIPMHYNMAAEVDRYGSKKELWIPVIMVVVPIYIILMIVPRVENKAQQDAKWQQSFYRLRFFLQLCLSAVACWIVYTSQNPERMEPALILGALCALFAGLGWLIPADGASNAFAIRTPWTRNHPTIEAKTRKFTRAFWILGGLLGIPLVVLLPSSWQFPVWLLWLLIMAFSPVVYSWRIGRPHS